jgi:peptide chain release factor 1
MKFKKDDVKIETKVGDGPGGQHRNKTESCVVVTHLSTGIKVKIDERNQHQSRRKALKELEKRVEEHIEDQRAIKRKHRRDRVIKERNRVRTYDYSRGVVTDHRTGKIASIKDILEKGKIGKLR